MKLKEDPILCRFDFLYEVVKKAVKSVQPFESCELQSNIELLNENVTIDSLRCQAIPKRDLLKSSELSPVIYPWMAVFIGRSKAYF